MLHLSCSYELVGEVGLVHGVEFYPKLNTFLSRQTAPHTYADLAERGTFEHRIAVPQPGQPFLKQSDNLQLWLFAAVRNESGEWTTNEAGSNVVPLAQILRPDKATRVDLDLALWNAYDQKTNRVPVKARLRLTVQPTDMSACAQPFLPLEPYELVDSNRERIVTQLGNYIQRTGAVYSSFGATYDSIKYLHLPLFQWCQFQLPGQAFAAVRADQPSSEKWWRQAANIALRSHYTGARSVKEARQLLLNETDQNRVMQVFAKLIGGTVNRVSTYLADEVYTNGRAISVNADTVTTSVEAGFTRRSRRLPVSKPAPVGLDLMRVCSAGGGSFLPAEDTAMAARIPIEAFSVGRLRYARDPSRGVQGTGDCEDVTCEAGMLDHELRTGKFSDPVLQKLSAARQNYVYIQSLAGVRGRQLSDAEKAKVSDSEHSDLGGHLFGMLMPVRDLLQIHGRFNKANPSFEGLEKRVGAEGLKSLWVENTGLMEPLGDPNYISSADHLRYLTADSEKLFLRCKIMQVTSRSQPNPFIKAVNSGTITDLADEYGTVEHMWLSSQTGRWTIGTDFLALANNQSHVASYAMPEFTPEEIQAVKSVLEHRMPVPAYPDPTHDVEIGQPVNEMLESVRQHTASLGRKAGPNTRKVDVVQLYPNLSAEFVSALRKHISARPGIVGYEYYDDNLGPGIGAFTHRFEVSLAGGSH